MRTSLEVGARPRQGTGRWWMAAIAWYLLIATLSHAPGTDGVTSRRWLDQLGLGDLNGLLRMTAHMTMFGVQCLLVLRALGGSPGRWRDRRTLAALAITLGLAIADEAHQATVPLRHGRAIDVVFDMVGAVLGLAVAGALAWRRPATVGPGAPPHAAD